MASLALGEGRITRERYWQLVADGTIGTDDRVELLDGVIVAMSPQSPRHASARAALTGRLGRAVADTAYVRVQMPLDLSDVSTPEPDLAVVAGKAADHVVAHPTAALLVIEVADSSLIQDRLTKAPIYAAAGVPEYWIVNLRDRCVEVHRGPLPAERRYGELQVLGPGDVLEAVALPGSVLPVTELFPTQ